MAVNCRGCRNLTIGKKKSYGKKNERKEEEDREEGERGERGDISRALFDGPPSPLSAFASVRPRESRGGVVDDCSS